VVPRRCPRPLGHDLLTNWRTDLFLYSEDQSRD
jgi:hypothetical protein